MAESKSSLLAKSVQKHAGRAKEKLLQNLGKVDRTADEIFDEHLLNFNRQQTNANRLQKEFNNYIRCIRAVQASSKLLMEAIGDVYETPWTGSETLHTQVTTIETLWADFSHKLGDQVLIPLNTYTAQFPEMKKKIEKRSRKLIDYDSQRHSFQSLQASSNKRRDDVKVTKGREQLEEARRTYEILNTELHDELPALHDSRILFLVTNLQTLFASEQVFHSETSKLFAELEAVVDKLASDSQRGSYTIKKINGNLNSPPHSPSQLISSTTGGGQVANNGQLTNGGGSPNANSPATPSTSTPSSSPPASLLESAQPQPQPQSRASSEPTATATAAAQQRSGGPHHSSSDDDDEDRDPEYQNAGFTAAAAAAPAKPKAADDATTVANTQNNNAIAAAETGANNNGAARIEAEYANGNVLVDGQTTATAAAAAPLTNGKDSKDGAAKDGAAIVAASTVATAGAAVAASAVVSAASDSTTAELPPGGLYRVRATYKYLKEDVDELSFDVGDTICVIEYDDPEDQEEGWLMGTKEGTTEKGLFPANFTRPL